MNLSFALPAALTVSLITLFATSPFISFSDPAPLKPTLRTCGHVVLISSPRHGSTWFLDSAEGCPSRETETGNYHDLIRNTELWTSHQGPVYNLTAREAADYVERNSSVKVFPSAYQSDVERLKEFFQGVKEKQIPVFVLNRRLEDSYGSLGEARESSVWSKNSMNEQKERVIEVDEKFERYRNGMERYFEKVKQVMKDVGLEWDRFDYEDARGMAEIVGERNDCIIKNCNFL